MCAYAKASFRIMHHQAGIMSFRANINGHFQCVEFGVRDTSTSLGTFAHDQAQSVSHT